jgi:HD-GYP domain-containing protein (c-di-GMP phosphodiesterase class II)
MALLREQAGTGFDPRCVNALAEVLDREAGHEDELGTRPGERRAQVAAGPAGDRLGVVSLRAGT